MEAMRGTRRSLAVLWAVLVAAGCGSGSGSGSGGDTIPPAQVTSATRPPQPTPTFTAGQYSVAGEVFSIQTGMLSAGVDVWVSRAQDFSYAWGWARGGLQSDELGRFILQDVPESELWITAHRPGFVQPCAVRAKVPGSSWVRVEMLPTATLEVPNAPRPQTSVEPYVVGSVYELTTGGPKPVTGAIAWAGDPLGITAAQTITDGGGGFFLCNLPAGVSVVLVKDGYVSVELGPEQLAAPGPLRVELKRS